MTLLTEKPSPPAAAPPGVRGALRPQDSRGTYVLGFLAALALHGLLILFWPRSHLLDKQAEFDVESGDASVEVSLVAALPAEEEQPKETPPDPPPPPLPTQKEEPPPPPPDRPPEMTIPAPPPQPPAPEQKPLQPEPKREKPPQPPKAKSHPAVSHPAGDGSSRIPGNDATTAHASSGALGAKPAYLRNPHPAYPEEARAAKQQGVVTLRVSVDASGHVAGVRIVQSSGFPILDERARSTVAEKWIFKPAMSGGSPVASEVIIPIRFKLER